MAFSITAELPLGTYRGHASDGGVERIPSVVRLHSALLCAAGFGPRARPENGGLVPDEADDAALRWLEQHPPDSVSVPPIVVNGGAATAHRDDGTIKPKKSGIKKLAKPAGSSVAVAGAFRWTWTEPPPPAVVAALSELCPEVSHLGTSESPVRLRTTDDEPDPTHVLDHDADLFTGAGQDIDLPVAGRVDELMDAHRQAVSKAPSVARDRARTDEDARSPVPSRSRIRPARYAPVQAESGEAPWPEVLVLPLDRWIAHRDRVRWATAAHRALIRILDEEAPPLLTGAYPPGTPRPANRVALQILDPGQPDDLVGGDHSALAVLLPRDAAEGEIEVVLKALRSLTTFRGPRKETARIVAHARYCSGQRFWPQKPAGTVRLWQTHPAAVPDTRGDGPDWTFLHAALLSLGFVWQASSHLPRIRGRGSARDRGLVDAVNAAGAVVVSARPLRVTSVGDYVHRVHPHAVVRPYRATVSLGSLGGDCTLQAIGQSRHLGGGLLVPFDVPEGIALDEVSGDGR